MSDSPHRDTSTAPTHPAAAGFRLPAEWEPHEGCWLAWPEGEELWGAYLDGAREAVVGLCAAIGGRDGGGPCEGVHLLVRDASAEEGARAALATVGRLPVRFHRIPYGDIWLRDTAPIFVRDAGTVAAVRFGFNGWGGKYLFEHDPEVSKRIAARTGLTTFSYPWILEGGSIDGDGDGTCLTTRQCLLNPNRNPGMTREAIEAGLRDALGLERILWLDRGLLNDHTDGHVDTIARFVAPGVVVCMEPSTPDDPNADVLEEIARDLARFTDARGRRLRVVRIPSPGLVLDDGDRIVPASYVNFYVANGAVAVPTYGRPQDRQALDTISGLFPGRRTIGIPATALVASGGGALHCITQQMPAPVPALALAAPEV